MNPLSIALYVGLVLLGFVAGAFVLRLTRGSSVVAKVESTVEADVHAVALKALNASLAVLTSTADSEKKIADGQALVAQGVADKQERDQRVAQLRAKFGTLA